MINLARHEPDPATIEEVTRLATDELSEAGIEPLTLPAAFRLGEVPSRVIGALHGWTFERAWYYWRAEGPGLPAEVADRLHAAHGSEVRVNGDCCAPSPREVFHGLGVGRYHVDSQAGLNALAATLRSVVEEAAAPPGIPEGDARDAYQGGLRLLGWETGAAVPRAAAAAPPAPAPAPAAGVSKEEVLHLIRQTARDLDELDGSQLPTGKAMARLFSAVDTLPEAAPRPTLQARVDPWLLECFGEEIARDKVERNHRFLEESLELAQSCGCIEEDARALVDYVYGRPKGDAFQEVGGVLITLAALCLAHGFDMHAAGEEELARIWGAIGKIRAKQAAKPKGSPLPQAVAAPPSGVDREADGWHYLPELPEIDRRVELASVVSRAGQPLEIVTCTVASWRGRTAAFYAWRYISEPPPPLPEAKA